MLEQNPRQNFCISCGWIPNYLKDLPGPSSTQILSGICDIDLPDIFSQIRADLVSNLIFTRWRDVKKCTLLYLRSFKSTNNKTKTIFLFFSFISQEENLIIQLKSIAKVARLIFRNLRKFFFLSFVSAYRRSHVDGLNSRFVGWFFGCEAKKPQREGNYFDDLIRYVFILRFFLRGGVEGGEGIRYTQAPK